MFAKPLSFTVVIIAVLVIVAIIAVGVFLVNIYKE